MALDAGHNLVHEFLEKSSKNYPDKIALIQNDDRVTYSQINNQSNRLAYWLITQEVQRERIALLFENSLEYVAGYYGALKAGAVVSSISTDIKPQGLEYLLQQLEPKVLISSFRFERVLKASNLQDTSLKALVIKKPRLDWSSEDLSAFTWDEIISEQDSENPSLPIEDSELASIVFTSGSTGKPKGVMLSHENIVSNTHSICQSLCITKNDIQMVVLPFFYVMGLSLLNTHFSVGGTVVINNKFAFPATVIKQMVEECVTAFSGVPSSYAYLLHRSPLADYREELKSLRYCSQAGGHMSRSVKEELLRILPENANIHIMYGATEASARLTCLEAEQYKDKMDSIGKPIPEVTIKILNEKAKQVELGQVGELVGSGPNIMQGYWNDEKASARVLDENGYHTGDLGYQDDEGYLYLVGRKDSLLKVGGHRINPQEIEDSLMETKLVLEVVVLGVPDELLGHRLIALVTPIGEGVNPNKILEKCTARLPRYKVPSKIILVKVIPKSTSGKFDRIKCLAFIKD